MAERSLLIDGAKLRDVRRRRDWAQVELAKRVGRDQTTLSRWESADAVRLDVSVVDAICRALHVRRRDLTSTAVCVWCGKAPAPPSDPLVMVGTYGPAHLRDCADAVEAALVEAVPS